jgi:hypothetical protein
VEIKEPNWAVSPPFWAVYAAKFGFFAYKNLELVWIFSS